VTASGEVFDPNGFTAHRTLPFGTRLMVSYRGRSVQVTVNDRGPYTGGRDLDLSRGAAEYLGLTRAGVDWVDYTVMGRGGYHAWHNLRAMWPEGRLATPEATQATGMPPAGQMRVAAPTMWCVLEIPCRR
jgi:rare lipoprotein A